MQEIDTDCQRLSCVARRSPIVLGTCQLGVGRTGQITRMPSFEEALAFRTS